ncbi:MAG: hypothetical protein ACJAS1_001382 [Oleiphilaceae bacterium]|jgi:hypothetical protein
MMFVWVENGKTFTFAKLAHKKKLIDRNYAGCNVTY